MKTYCEGANKSTGSCRNCGQQLGIGEALTYEVWGYPWDGSDTEGSVTRCLETYIVCNQATDCARRVVEQGTNMAALRRVASDYENLGQLAVQARNILGEWSELAQEIAHTDDLVAREQGYGGIESLHWRHNG